MCAESITIGRNVIVSYHVTIADSDLHPRGPELRRLDAIANAPEGDRGDRPPLVTAPVIIEDDVWIGIGAIILPFSHPSIAITERHPSGQVAEHAVSLLRVPIANHSYRAW
jgi:acetyltransferase-like isoleucine patch superfamily enzyme